MSEKQFKLPKKFWEKWKEALLSGDYNQGIHSLYNKKEDCYCCLGVAAAVCEIDTEHMDTSYFRNEGAQSEHHNNLTREAIKKEYPLELINGSNGEDKYNLSRLADKLMTRNDEGETFEEIVEWIELNVEFY